MSWFSDLFGMDSTPTTTVVDPATNDKGFWNSNALGPILSVGSQLLGGYFAGKAADASSDKAFEQQKELLRLRAELGGGGGGGGNSAANELAKRQMAIEGLKSLIASNNASQTLMSNATQGVGTAAARAYFRNRGG